MNIFASFFVSLAESFRHQDLSSVGARLAAVDSLGLRSGLRGWQRLPVNRCQTCNRFEGRCFRMVDEMWWDVMRWFKRVANGWQTSVSQRIRVNRLNGHSYFKRNRIKFTFFKSLKFPNYFRFLPQVLYFLNFSEAMNLCSALYTSAAPLLFQSQPGLGNLAKRSSWQLGWWMVVGRWGGEDWKCRVRFWESDGWRLKQLRHLYSRGVFDYCDKANP